MTLDQAIERLYDLHPGVTPVAEGAPHERPHKPLLILAALDLIDEGNATPERIPWCQDLRDRFTARFLQVRKHNDQNTPENPFVRLQTQGFWQAWVEEKNRRLPMDRDIIAPGRFQFQLYTPQKIRPPAERSSFPSRKKSTEMAAEEAHRMNSPPTKNQRIVIR